MSHFNINSQVPVKDVMSSPVIAVNEDDNVEHIARIMTERDIESIVVINEIGNPVGMITERDLVVRVATKNLLPSTVKAKDIMTSPLRVINPNEDITAAAKMMREYNIRI